MCELHTQNIQNNTQNTKYKNTQNKWVTDHGNKPKLHYKIKTFKIHEI